MGKILITGATGNVGLEVVKYLFKLEATKGSGEPNIIIVGVRDIEKSKVAFTNHPNLGFVHFDFEDPDTFNDALTGINMVFLLRPPHISDVEKYFKPLISSIKNKGINQIVFLSVQGAEKSKVIPHNKIERLITGSGIDYIFLRPSYFMQNLTTTLISDIRAKREIILPSGNAKFNWIDIENIGETAAILLNKFDDHKNKAYELTGLENESFGKVTSLINQSVQNPITYRNVNPLRFYKMKRKEGMVKGMIIVMILLHFLPRFQKEPLISNFYEKLTGQKPTDLKTFIERERKIFD